MLFGAVSALFNCFYRDIMPVWSATRAAAGMAGPSSKQRFLVFGEQFVVDLPQRRVVDDTVGDDGLPLAPGIEGGIPRLFEQPLDLVQRCLQPQADAQQPVPGGLAPPGKHLVEIHLADARLPGHLRLGQLFPIEQSRQQAEHTAVGEFFLIVTDVSVQIGLFHQFLLQIAGRFGFHCSRPFTFPPKYYILILQNFSCENNMLAA